MFCLILYSYFKSIINLKTNIEITGNKKKNSRSLSQGNFEKCSFINGKTINSLKIEEKEMKKSKIETGHHH